MKTIEEQRTLLRREVMAVGALEWHAAQYQRIKAEQVRVRRCLAIAESQLRATIREARETMTPEQRERLESLMPDVAVWLDDSGTLSKVA